MEHPPAFSPVHDAVAKGDRAAVDRCLQEGCDLEERSRSMTVLQSAAHWGRYDLLPILLQHGAQVNALPSELGCVLQTAITSIRTGSMPDKLLIKTFPSLDEKSVARENAILSLLSHGATVDQIGGEFGTPLAAAAALGLTRIVHLLLQKGADPSSYGGRLGSALQAGCAHGELPVEWLVSPAGLEDYEIIISTLIGAGCSVDHVGGRYGTALQAAAWFGDLEAVRQLLRAGCDHSIVAGKYGTALEAARSESHAKIVGELIQVGANPRTNASQRHENDDWTTWRDIPVSSMFLKYSAPLPSVRLP